MVSRNLNKVYLGKALGTITTLSHQFAYDAAALIVSDKLYEYKIRALYVATYVHSIFSVIVNWQIEIGSVDKINVYSEIAYYYNVSSKRDSVVCFRTPRLAVATATRNRSRNSLVSAADDRAAPERNRRDSPLARRARNARGASPDTARAPSIIIQSPRERGPTRPTATPLPRTDPAAKDRISRYVPIREYTDGGVYLASIRRPFAAMPIEPSIPQIP